jgi:organic radical activating enzyme
MKKSDVNWNKDDGSLIHEENLPQMKELLDNTGCGFCLAKWTQVTTHLGSGITHSCHHVGAHKIPIVELESNPSALHNTLEKKERRKEMLAGKRPKECDYCWRIEDNTDSYSDRIQKSMQSWGIVDHDRIIESTGDENINPRYMEISFSNVCNFKCSYCGPPFSSKWTEEIKSNGPYKLHMTHYNGIKEHEVQIPNREHNPYVEAFWKWWPDLVKDLMVFRITGGEPLLSKDTWKVLDYLEEHPQPHLKLSINTNSCVEEKLYQKFVKQLNVLTKNNCVKHIEIHTSAESTGLQAEYSRDGMDWQLFTSNVTYLLLNAKKVKLNFMSAFNILSLPTFGSYIHYIKKLKKVHGDKVSCDFAFVRHPHFLDIKIATRDMVLKYLKPALEFMQESTEFNDWEKQRLLRIYKDCESRFDKEHEHVRRYRYQFYQFVEQYDKRRNKDFIKTFPQYKTFLRMCKNSYV